MFSQPLPAMTSLMDPASVISLPAPDLDLFDPAFAWQDDNERLELVFQQKKLSNHILKFTNLSNFPT